MARLHGINPAALAHDLADKLGPAEPGDPQTQALLHPFRETFHPVIGAVSEPNRFERAGDLGLPPGARQAGQLTMKAQHFARLHPTLVAKKLRQVTKSPAG